MSFRRSDRFFTLDVVRFSELSQIWIRGSKVVGDLPVLSERFVPTRSVPRLCANQTTSIGDSFSR